jgi:chromosomal replication initiator protein
MNRANFNTFVKGAELLRYEDGTFVIQVRNAYSKDYLEKKLHASLLQTLSSIFGRPVELRFLVWASAADEVSPLNVQTLPASGNGSSRHSNNHHVSSLDRFGNFLNSRYTFENFIVGPSNELAYAAVNAAANNPGLLYNPVFLYGGVGLGKTHLLHAVGHACYDRGLDVCYVTTERFTNDLITAIRTGDTEDFRHTYRLVDVLLIDDIQFLSGKNQTQEEMFHTFNALHGQDKQVVITSDRPPHELPNLEERLRSRFQWGLLADIQPPDLETRMAIVSSKAEQQGIELSLGVQEIVARSVISNIRELEGAINRVVAYASFTERETITTELAERALDGYAVPINDLTTADILQAVADYYKIALDDLISSTRRKAISNPRQVAMFLAREVTDESLPQIGDAIGGRDHTTILHGVNKMAELEEEDKDIQRDLAALREKLRFLQRS